MLKKLVSSLNPIIDVKFLIPAKFINLHNPFIMSSVLPAFASRLNSMKSKPELWEGPEDLIGWIHRQGTITGLELVDFNYPEHLEGYSLAEVKIALSEAGLSTGAVCLRYPKHFSLGAFTNPAASLRREAIQLTECWSMGEGASARELIVWPAYDGMTILSGKLRELWQYVVQSFREVCDFFPELRVSLEPKPTEPRRYFIQNTTGAGLLMVLEVDRENMGLTLDFGHCMMAGENPAQSVSMVGKHKKLWGMQLNDGCPSRRRWDAPWFCSSTTDLGMPPLASTYSI